MNLNIGQTYATQAQGSVPILLIIKMCQTHVEQLGKMTLNYFKQIQSEQIKM